MGRAQPPSFHPKPVLNWDVTDGKILVPDFCPTTAEAELDRARALGWANARLVAHLKRVSTDWTISKNPPLRCLTTLEHASPSLPFWTTFLQSR